MKKALFIGLLLLAACSKSEQPAANTPAAAPATASADTGRSTELINQYGCVGCHVIPGFGGGGTLGPSLEHYGKAGTIVQKFPNNPQNLTQWLVSPQSMDPNTTMPPSGMSEAEAKVVATYLLTLK
jgi:cytochrome c1